MTTNAWLASAVTKICGGTIPLDLELVPQTIGGDAWFLRESGSNVIIPDDIAHAAIRDYLREKIENRAIRSGTLQFKSDDGKWYSTRLAVDASHSDKTVSLALLAARVIGIELEEPNV